MLTTLLLSATISAQASDLIGFSITNPDWDPDWELEYSDTCEPIEVSDEIAELMALIVQANTDFTDLCDELTDDDEICVTSLDWHAAAQNQYISDDGDGIDLSFLFEIDEDTGDSTWKGCSEGDPDVPTSDNFKTTPGHKYIDSLTLRGPLVSQREALCVWITEVIQGEDWKRGVIVTEILKDGSSGKTFTYIDCFPTKYVFPELSGSGTGDLYEEINVKPIRLELS